MSSKQKTTQSGDNQKQEKDFEKMGRDVLKYLETHFANLDKADITKYVAVALVVLYGVRRSSILSSVAVSLITALVAKFLAEQIEGKETNDEEAPDAAS
jgi:hypothetical protein